MISCKKVINNHLNLIIQSNSFLWIILFINIFLSTFIVSVLAKINDIEASEFTRYNKLNFIMIKHWQPFLVNHRCKSLFECIGFEIIHLIQLVFSIETDVFKFVLTTKWKNLKCLSSFCYYFITLWQVYFLHFI